MFNIQTNLKFERFGLFQAILSENDAVKCC